MIWYLKQFSISDGLRSHQNELIKLTLIWIFVSSFSTIEFKAYGISINIAKDTDLEFWAYLLLALFGVFYLLRFVKEYFSFARLMSWKNVPDRAEDTSAGKKVEDNSSASVETVTQAEITLQAAAAHEENLTQDFSSNDLAYKIASTVLLLFDLVVPLALTIFSAMQAAL